MIQTTHLVLNQSPDRLWERGERGHCYHLVTFSFLHHCHWPLVGHYISRSWTVTVLMIARPVLRWKVRRQNNIFQYALHCYYYCYCFSFIVRETTQYLLENCCIKPYEISFILFIPAAEALLHIKSTVKKSLDPFK